MTQRPPPKAITYDLRPRTSGQDFYQTLAHFSDTVLAHVESRASAHLTSYAAFVAARGEAPRSRGEYAVELLTLGMTWVRYAGAAERSPKAAVSLCRILYSLRRYPRLKPFVDRWRGKLAGAYLVPKIGTPLDQGQGGLQTFRRLVTWLSATGEFRLEVRRLRNLYAFGKSEGIAAFESIRDTALDCLSWFEGEANRILGPYTESVPRFLAEEHPRYRGREDEIFCGKPRLEYHVAMVASELMNRGLSAEFLRTKKRVLLLPACMRPANGSACKAERVGDEIRCRRCSSSCAIGRITQLGRDNDFTTYLVPHSSSFTRWLLRWKASTETGVVAVACLPNIVPGGYEMRDLAIPSQCVPLDYCGCQKHWHDSGVPTAVNERRLLKVIQPVPMGPQTTPNSVAT